MIPISVYHYSNDRFQKGCAVCLNEETILSIASVGTYLDTKIDGSCHLIERMISLYMSNESYEYLLSEYVRFRR